jgi:ATP-dependent phosphofructokinase / diphosphate-dependent phosphofructokinase
MTKQIGILTAGGDSPGLNAAIRGIGKSANSRPGMQVIGFKDGFRGLVENRFIRLDNDLLSGILTIGGTILGTSRDKPHKMPLGGKKVDMTDVIVENYHNHHLDALVCLGGGGTQKNAYKLMEKGLNVITLPKTIDNDVEHTDTTFGFDTAMGIAVEAIDRLHSTAHSHHRIMIVEIMGHRAGWLALGAGIAGGADAILIPEIPYDVKIVADSILERSRNGKRFSIVTIAEGAMPKEGADKINILKLKLDSITEPEARSDLKNSIKILEAQYTGKAIALAEELQKITGLESRLTILGHLQRGGTPSAADRLLATRLGTACIDYIERGIFGVMIAAKGDSTEAIPLKDVVNRVKMVPKEHPWVISARNVGTCFGN